MRIDERQASLRRNLQVFKAVSSRNVKRDLVESRVESEIFFMDTFHGMCLLRNLEVSYGMTFVVRRQSCRVGIKL